MNFINNTNNIEVLRKKLHKLIEDNASYEEIYQVSIELDNEIEKYIMPLERAN
ncbi:Spo0E like sporulation regulatory protein [Natranaerovirga pectinivora]|uniref:Spo0E like sporulation regulatory protein n=1 Tax=Natranaerovirga pectinivora TaxID=682400 RepID=A0A4R3MU84_9FIRM|nr:Spo0E family sporulation regulatory protein-aspartic acid phosphatase [Natranaerovirga pectinivora]TCT16846.1 Spo0E like sporulation regulatory protein [Natranaerovirga pectinivora]